MKILPLLFVFLFTAFVASSGQQVTVQTAYSESGVYTPRVITQVADKKKSDNAVAPKIAAENKPTNIRVSVLDFDRKPVVGLSKEDFKLFIDGQEVGLSSAESKAESVNYIFMLDMSMSSSVSSMDLAGRAQRVADRLSPSDRAMVISFSQTLKVVSDLTDDREVLKKAIKKATANASSGTSIYDHVRYLSENVIPKVSGPVAVVLITDGVDTTSNKSKFDTSLVAAESAAAQYYVIYLDTLPELLKQSAQFSRNVSALPIPLGVGRQLEPQKLRQDAEIAKLYLNDLMALSGGHIVSDAIMTGSNAILSSELPSIVNSQYVLTFTPRPGSIVGERHSLRVRVNRPNLAVIARGSFIAR